MNPLTPTERAALRAQHTPPEVPKCPVCGEPLIRRWKTTRGEWSYACPEHASYWDRPEPPEGRDPRVLRLLDLAERYEAALQQIHHQATDFCRRHCQGPRGHHPECGREYGELAGEALKGGGDAP